MRWIASDDVNVEHLPANFLTIINTNPDDVWNAYTNFMDHLYRHRLRQVILEPNIELPGDHPSRPRCLCERLLAHALTL